jgi:hypothetical protein
VFVALLSTDWYGFSVSIFIWLGVLEFVRMWSSVSVCGDAVRLLLTYDEKNAIGVCWYVGLER